MKTAIFRRTIVQGDRLCNEHALAQGLDEC